MFAIDDKRDQPESSSAEPPAKRVKVNTGTLIEPIQMPKKRRRISTKGDEPSNQDLCTKIVNRIKEIVKRVGKHDITEPDVVQMIQNLFHEKKIVKIIACKGTDRTLGPPRNMLPEEAPYRRTIAVLRETQVVKVDEHWEKWDDLLLRDKSWESMFLVTWI